MSQLKAEDERERTGSLLHTIQVVFVGGQAIGYAEAIK